MMRISAMILRKEKRWLDRLADVCKKIGPPAHNSLKAHILCQISGYEPQTGKL